MAQLVFLRRVEDNGISSFSFLEYSQFHLNQVNGNNDLTSDGYFMFKSLKKREKIALES